MLSTQLANFLRKMISFENAASSHGGLIPLKTSYEKRRNGSGRPRVRRTLLTCIQLLLLQFLHVIWSTATNFAFLYPPQKNPVEPP